MKLFHLISRAVKLWLSSGSEIQTPPRVCQYDFTVLLEVLTHPKLTFLRVADCNVQDHCSLEAFFALRDTENRPPQDLHWDHL